MRYALIGVAVVGSLSLAALATFYVVDQPYMHPGAFIEVAIPAAMALALGLAANGLIKRQAWAAYFLSVVAFLCALPVVFLILYLGPGNYSDQPPSPGFDPAWLLLLGALGLPVTIGGVAIAVGGDLRRQRREREASRYRSRDWAN